MKLYPMVLLLALTPLAVSCSPTEPKPTIRNVYIKTTLPPAARKSYPLTKKPETDIDQVTVYNMWSADRTARNNTEVARRACVMAVDATAAESDTPRP